MVDDWYNDKNKTCHNIWESRDKSMHHWVLFIMEGDVTGWYHSGTSSSFGDAEKEIKWIIATEIKRQNLL